MKKSTVIGIVLAILIIGVLGAVYIFSNNEDNTGTSADLENKVPNEVSGDSKVLVAYFSLPETDDPNDMTTDEENSVVVVDGEALGNTQYVAMLISDYTDGDLFRIEPVTPYTTDHDALTDQALEEQESDARPEIKDPLESIDDYDVIFVGYPIWWGDMPQILYTFLESYDFNGKTVIPFSTHGGSGLAGTVETISSKLDGANVLDNAFTMSRNDMEEAPDEVRSWLTEINMIGE